MGKDFTKYPFETRATDVHFSTRKGPYSTLVTSDPLRRAFPVSSRMFPYQNFQTGKGALKLDVEFPHSRANVQSAANAATFPLDALQFHSSACRTPGAVHVPRAKPSGQSIHATPDLESVEDTVEVFQLPHRGRRLWDPGDCWSRTRTRSLSRNAERRARRPGTIVGGERERERERESEKKRECDQLFSVVRSTDIVVSRHLGERCQNLARATLDSR